MTSYTWTSGKKGSWGTAADWAGGTVANSATADVTIAGTGSNVTIGSSNSYTVDSLTLDSGAPQLTIAGTLDFAGATNQLSLQSGLLDITGTLIGATIAQTGGTLTFIGSTWDNITDESPLNLTAASADLYLEGTDAFTGAAGTGPGTINLTGNGAALYTDDNFALNDATLNFGGAGTSDNIYLASNGGPVQALTLGGSLDVVQSATDSDDDIDLYSDTGAQATLVNRDTIAAGASGGYFYIYGPSGDTFTNQGSIIVSNGDHFDMSSLAGFNNTGLISATGAGTVFNLASTSWSNTGAISVSGGALLDLGGTFGLSALAGIINNGGTVGITGDLLDTGTLAVGAGSALGAVTLSGTITGGTVVDAGGALVSIDGELDGVTYEGTLGLTVAGGGLYLAGTDDFTGAGGTGPGTINLAGSGAALFTDDNFSLDDATLNFGGADTSDNIYLASNGGPVQALTLGPSLDVVQSAADSSDDIDLYSETGAQATLVNRGTIAAGASGGYFYIYGPSGDTFTNQGSIIVSNGDIFDISSVATFSNLKGTTLTGGAYEIGAGSTFQLAANSKITTDAASITLSGAGSVIEALNSTVGTEISLDSKLASIAATNTLALLAGRNFAATGSFSDSGDLTLGGVTFSATALSITSTGTLAGAGTVKSAITDAGVIIAAGGSLVLTGALAGAGGASIEAGADLTLGTAATGGAITFAGTGGKLTLDAPASVDEQIVSLAPSDTIDLAGLTATSASIAGGNLLISLSAGGTLDYSLANPNPADRFALSSDGHGGTDITVYGDADPEISPTTTNFGEQHAGALLTEFYTIGNENVFGAYQENLDAGFAGGTGGVTGSGSVNISVQASNATAISATLSSATGGLISGTGTIGFDSDGNGIDGLGTLALPPAIVTLTGTFFNYAIADFFGNTSIDFGNVHAGAVPTDSILLANAAAQGQYSENLDAGFVGASGNLITSGTVSELAAGFESFGLLISIGATNPGDQFGQATIALISDGAGIDTLGTTALGFETIAVSAVEYDYAAPSFASTIVTLGNVHVGGADSQALTIANSGVSPNAAYQEGLDAYFSGTSGVTAAGTVNLLGAGQIDSQDLSVGLATGAAGSFSGDAYLSQISDGALTSQLGTTALPGAEIAVSGAVFAYAAPSLSSTSINLGVIHVGDAGTAFLTLSNAAADPAFTEGLDAAFSGTSGAVLASGAVNLLAAGGMDDSHLELILSTGASGTFSGTATLAEVSDGELTSGLGITSLGSQIISLIGTVDNFATLGVAQTGGAGTLTSVDSRDYRLNLGSTAQGGTALTADLEVLNTAVGLADLLGGGFTVVSASAAFSNTGIGGFTGLGAGAADTAPELTLSTAIAGTFTEVLEIEAAGSNASGYTGTLNPVYVTITGTVASLGPEVFTLTPHADDFVGGAGNDTFIAANNCLSSGDILIGGSGLNTLELTGGGTFDMTAPATLTNISQVLAVEAKGKAEQSVFLRSGFTGTLTAASGASGSGIFIYGNHDSADIILGNGNDTVYVGSDSEKISSGKGNSIFYVTSATAGATIAAGKGANILAVSGGGDVQMGAAISGVALVKIIDTAVPGTTFTANNTANLVIDGGSGADTIILDAATQSVLAGGGATFIEASMKDAGAAITANSIGSVSLDLTTSGTGTLNTGDTDLFVTLGASSNLLLSKMGFVTVDGAAGKDKLTAMAANQTLIGGASDTLIGYAGFGDMFKGTAAELNGDTISLFGGTDLVDLTNVKSSLVSALHWTRSSKGGKLSISDGTHSAVIDFSGTYSASDFTFASDGALGTYIKFV